MIEVKHNNDYEFQNMLIEERDREIRMLLQQQKDINVIFKDLATLVDDQGEMIDDIRSNITSSNQNVKQANKDLGEAEESQKTGIKLALGILVAIVTTISATTLGVILGT
jgi:syntaxin 7